MAMVTTNPTAINRKLERRSEVKIGNNTTARNRTDGKAGHIIRLHASDIVITDGAGDAESFCMCGYGTMTTSDRINQFLPQWASLSQRNWEWSINIRVNDGVGGYRFESYPISDRDTVQVSTLERLRELAQQGITSKNQLVLA